MLTNFSRFKSITFPGQELGEGLNLTPSAGHSHTAPTTLNGNHRADLQQQHQQHQQQWPLKDLERIKNENRASALVGQNVVLNCAVQFKDGQEKPFVVNWFKYPHLVPIYIWYAGYPAHVAQGYEARVARIGQASLNLSSIRESDQGLYECKIHYLGRRPEDKTNATWVYLDVQGEYYS